MKQLLSRALHSNRLNSAQGNYKSVHKYFWLPASSILGAVSSVGFQSLNTQYSQVSEVSGSEAL